MDNFTVLKPNKIKGFIFRFPQLNLGAPRGTLDFIDFILHFSSIRPRNEKNNPYWH